MKYFLPPQMRDAFGVTPRVLSFEYDSNTAFTRTIQDLDELANKFLQDLIRRRPSEAERRRPLIFIAHGLGGILLKKVGTYAFDIFQSFFKGVIGL